MKITKAAKLILEKSGNPMPMEDLCEEIIKRKLHIFTENDLKSVIMKAIKQDAISHPHENHLLFSEENGVVSIVHVG